MLAFSYVVAAAAMLCAALYLIFRLRLFVTTSVMLLGSLLLIYGPAFLSYTLSSGAQSFLIRWALGLSTTAHPIFSIIGSKVPDTDAVITSMNFAVALMYTGIIGGIEGVTRFCPERAAAVQSAVSGWTAQPLQDEFADHRPLLMAILVLALFMVLISVTEDHFGQIAHFFSIKGDNDARNAYRAHFGASSNYPYRILLGAVAPMFVVWGGLAGILRRSWILLAAAVFLLAATMIGKIETLSKAPPAFFFVQLMLAGLLAYTNRLSWKLLILGCVAIALVLYATTKLIMILPEANSAFLAVYSRIFEAESQSLFENFAVFPAVHPFKWGTNIKLIAMLTGEPFVPAYQIVARTWYGTADVTSPSLFIADAWADFSYGGVFVLSMFAGSICRAIDLAYLAQGKSVTAIAVLSATFMGLFTLLNTALNTALLSGGLLLAPILAALMVIMMRASGSRAHGKPFR